VIIKYSQVRGGVSHLKAKPYDSYSWGSSLNFLDITIMDLERLKERYADNKIFVRLPKWITENSGLSGIKGAELKILLCICGKIDNKTDSAIITREHMSQETGVTLGTISGILHGLVMMGFIRIEKEGRNNTYFVQFHPPQSWPESRIVNKKRLAATSGRRSVFKNTLSHYYYKDNNNAENTEEENSSL